MSNATLPNSVIAGARPGPRNLITDVDGLLVGNAVDEPMATGVTVLRAPMRAAAAVDVRGGGPGTRETDLLSSENTVRAVDAIVLSGGSVYGLEAASAVTNWLGARGHGYSLLNTPYVAPIVPAAILFDLTNGGSKDWGETPPYHRLGIEAVAAAGQDFPLGNVGAGYGARAGAYKGGLGSASVVTEAGFVVGALVAVNAFGSPLMPGTTTLWAQPYAMGDEMGPRQPYPMGEMPAGLPDDTKLSLAQGLSSAQEGQNTTIGIVATNADLSAGEAKRLAVMAQDGFARTLRPVHAPVDGDVIFAVGTGEKPMGDWPVLALLELGSLAADCMARAVGRAVWEAQGTADAPGLQDLRKA
ncbi:MAG: P1 family peptidase [Pseudomonadota bacterium]